MSHLRGETTKGDNNCVNVFTTCVQTGSGGIAGARCRREMMIELNVLKPEMSIDRATTGRFRFGNGETAQTERL